MGVAPLLVRRCQTAGSSSSGGGVHGLDRLKALTVCEIYLMLAGEPALQTGRVTSILGQRVLVQVIEKQSRNGRNWIKFPASTVALFF